MRLLLIRHGQSLANLAWIQGQEAHTDSDTPLTDLGHSQAASLAQGFQQGLLPKPDHLMSSLMVRALQTSAYVADMLDVPVVGLPDAYEVRDSADEGTYVEHAADVLRSYCPRLVLPEDAGFRPPEERTEAWGRAQRVVARLRDNYGGTDDVVVLVTHAMFMQLLWRAIIDWRPDLSSPLMGEWFHASNTGTVYLLTPGEYKEKATIYWMNRCDHLTPDQISD